MRILGSNAKTKKSIKDGVLIASLQLSPATESVEFGGRNMCPEASACAKACLKYAGMNVMPTHVQARVNRTLFYLASADEFHRQVNHELQALKRKAERLGLEPACRPNTLSDVPQMAIRVAEENPWLQVYDYTKRLKWWAKHGGLKSYAGTLIGDRPLNYTVVLSRSETNEDQWASMMRTGKWAGAVVFDTRDPEEFPTHYMGFPVVNGDSDDTVWRAKPGVVRGLTLKGTKAAKKAARDSGFAVAI